MRTFIETYLSDPSHAIEQARLQVSGNNWYDEIDDDAVYKAIASPEFRLYEEMIMAGLADDSPQTRDFVSVA